MWFGAEARARLIVLPVFAIGIPWRCSLGPPLAGRGQAAPSVTTEKREPPAISAANGKREPPVVSAATDKQELPAGPAATDKQEPPAVSAATEKREPPTQRVSSAPPRLPPVPTVTLPEEIVLKAMSLGQVQFIRCWKRAQQADPGLDAAKVRLRIEVDAAGRVTSATSDTESAVLARCLANVARQLPFPAPGQAAVVDLPLMFP